MSRVLKVRRTIELPVDLYDRLITRAEPGRVNTLILRYIEEGLEADEVKDRSLRPVTVRRQ